MTILLRYRNGYLVEREIPNTDPPKFYQLDAPNRTDQVWGSDILIPSFVRFRLEGTRECQGVQVPYYMEE